GDPSMFWGETHYGGACVVDVVPGDYLVFAKGMDFLGARYVAAVRAIRVGAKKVCVGAKVGEAGTDYAPIGVADQPALFSSVIAASPGGADAGLDFWVERLESVPGDWGVVQPNPKEEVWMVRVPSGFGDGSGPVHELLDEGSRVGIEHVFIPPGTLWRHG